MHNRNQIFYSEFTCVLYLIYISNVTTSILNHWWQHLSSHSFYYFNHGSAYYDLTVMGRYSRVSPLEMLPQYTVVLVTLDMLYTSSKDICLWVPEIIQTQPLKLLCALCNICIKKTMHTLVNKATVTNKAEVTSLSIQWCTSQNKDRYEWNWTVIPFSNLYYLITEMKVHRHRLDWATTLVKKKKNSLILHVGTLNKANIMSKQRPLQHVATI